MASISLLFKPVMEIVFFLDLWPLTRDIMDFFMPSTWERNTIHSAFARPSCGGAVILSFIASPWTPATSHLDEPGKTCT